MMFVILLLVKFGAGVALPPKVETVEIAPGVQMPLVSLGTARGCPPNVTAIENDIPMALSVGFAGIDTAHNDPCYNDTVVGKALKGIDRDSYFLVSKIPSAFSVNPSQTSKQLEAGLHNLGLPYVDLMLIHHPGKAHSQSFEASLQQQWAAMEEFYKAGKARAIGVSNFCRRAMEAILQTATVKPAVNQILYHAGMGNDADGVVSFAHAHNITLMAFSPVDEGNPVLIKGEPYKSIGATHGKTPVQVALRWLVQRGLAFVVASDKKAYMEEDINIFDFKLTPAEVANISSQHSCRAGGMKPPYCLPYWPGPEDCCNLDTRGTQCISTMEAYV